MFLITGSHGYIGSLLTRYLFVNDISYRTCDTLWFENACVAHDIQSPPDHADFSQLTVNNLHDVTTVVHLAAYSNDPTGSMDHAATMWLNHTATVEFSKTARAAGVRTFVFASSCSVYGDTHDDLVDEDSATRPLTAYAMSKKRAEDDLLALQTPEFRVAILRGATAFGASDVPRTDLLLNEFSAQAALLRPLVLNSLGTSWRPFMPISEFVRALVAAALTPPQDTGKPPVWNIAPEQMQMTVREATQRAAAVAGLSAPVPPTGAVADKRSYRVNGQRFLHAYPDFAFQSSFEDEISKTVAAFKAIPSLAADLAAQRFVRLAALRQDGRLAG